MTYWCGCTEVVCAGVEVAKLGFCDMENEGKTPIPGQALCGSLKLVSADELKKAVSRKKEQLQFLENLKMGEFLIVNANTIVATFFAIALKSLLD
ncbi:hypothetical protein E2542_SST02319 [Spatholobus suberectus]|nr:hypothetical protein E2542_SST02319 [Spatholobus suberectus]